ncbi:MAG: hypothetical protein WCO26_14580 [Deltaproteobacteria bacterium]
MMTNRYAFVAAAIVATFLLTGCQTAQKSGSTVSAAPSEKADSPKDTQKVKGINGWEGEISGKPAPGSKFTKLKIGMGMKQVIDLVGQPTDQGTYVTGKAWIPYYYGSDRYRHEMVYKGQGRLIFAGGSSGDSSSGNLTSIIHNAQESGYR